MYSIGQVAEMFGLPISTLRYYDKQGLFPNMERVSGLSLIHISEPTRRTPISYAVFCLKKKNPPPTTHPPPTPQERDER